MCLVLFHAPLVTIMHVLFVVGLTNKVIGK